MLKKRGNKYYDKMSIREAFLMLMNNMINMGGKAYKIQQNYKPMHHFYTMKTKSSLV